MVIGPAWAGEISARVTAVTPAAVEATVTMTPGACAASRASSAITDVASLDGRRIATGAVDSPQATLIPLAHLRGLGVTAEIRRFEVGVGLHARSLALISDGGHMLADAGALMLALFAQR